MLKYAQIKTRSDSVYIYMIDDKRVNCKYNHDKIKQNLKIRTISNQ